MRDPRANIGQLIAGVGGVLLFIFLFVAWVSVGNASASAWEIFSSVDIILAALAIAVVAICASRLFPAAPDAPWLRTDALKWLGVIALTITLTYILEADNIGIGAIVALLACIAIVAGAILSERPELARRVVAAADAATGSADTGTGAPAAKPIPPAAPQSGSAPGAGATGAPGAGAGQGSESPTAVQPSSPAGGAAAGGAAAAASPSASAGEAPASGGGPPAGWYPDPQGEARLRYWDGSAWTEQTSA